MWRETMLTPSFFLLDAHCIFVLPRFLFCIRSWTFAVLLATVLSFAAMRMFPYRPASAVREFRSALAVLCASPLATTDCVLWWITALSIAFRAKKRFSHWSAFAVCCRCPPCKAPRFCRFFSGAQSWQEQKLSCAVVFSVIRCLRRPRSQRRSSSSPVVSCQQDAVGQN